MQFVLIHGAGSSGQTWASVADVLLEEGHGVTCPDLPSPEASSLSEHVGVVRQELARLTAHSPVLLAGHSYGGMVISEAARDFAPRLHGMVYFDAVLPVCGKSLVEMAREAGVERLEDFGVGDHGPFTDPSCVRWEALRPVPKLYVQFTKGNFASMSGEMRRSVELQGAEANWRTGELAWGHHAQRECPDETARILLDFARSVERRG